MLGEPKEGGAAPFGSSEMLWRAHAAAAHGGSWRGGEPEREGEKGRVHTDQELTLETTLCLEKPGEAGGRRNHPRTAAAGGEEDGPIRAIHGVPARDTRRRGRGG